MAAKKESKVSPGAKTTKKKVAKKTKAPATKKKTKTTRKKKVSPASIQRRVAIVAGVRTPFLKSGGAYKKMAARHLGALAVSELIAKTQLDSKSVDQVVFGQVVADVAAPNIAREIVLATPLDTDVEAYSVSRACATSTQALVSAAHAILHGDADVAICGGADTLSRPPITYSDTFVDALMSANRAKTPIDKARAFLKLRPADLLPQPPAIKELSTGLTMGESAEKMAQENGISRADQDAFALRSHLKAAAAWQDGIFDDEVMTVHMPPRFDRSVDKDNIVRAETSLEKLAKLRPAFDKRYGSITAGSSSPLTDGASALLLMEASVAESLGYTPLAYLKSWAFSAIDPEWQLLMGPAFAAPKALDRAGLGLSDMDLVDMHEAFAAQVLSNLWAFSSKTFSEQYLNRSTPLGEVPDEKLNIYGGSIALGHPFAATGTRQALTMAKELSRRGGGHALITQCAAGGLGAAVILEGA